MARYSIARVKSERKAHKEAVLKLNTTRRSRACAHCIGETDAAAAASRGPRDSEWEMGKLRLVAPACCSEKFNKRLWASPDCRRRVFFPLPDFVLAQLLSLLYSFGARLRVSRNLAWNFISALFSPRTGPSAAPVLRCCALLLSLRCWLFFCWGECGALVFSRGSARICHPDKRWLERLALSEKFAFPFSCGWLAFLHLCYSVIRTSVD